MKKIYFNIISLMMAAISFSSCSDWLDINPSDEIKEEFLFNNGDGFQTALNGIYRQMASFSLYGSNLTWGIVDAWGQAYSLEKAPTSGAGQAMHKIAGLKFSNSQLTPTTDKMWNSAWNTIANCNNLIQQTEKADSTIFYKSEYERQLILGEAIGLRAYMHFDLLRIYAPAPSANPGSTTYIPYVNYYPAYVNENISVPECLEHIISDLKKAQAILYKLEVEGEKPRSLKPKDRFVNAASGKNLFYALRGYRLNYWAATALLARVYLYAGMKQEAYNECKILIDEEKKYGFFKAVTSTYSGPRNIEAGNIKMYENIIFGLYSPTELVDWDAAINHNSDGADEYYQFYLCWSSDMVEEYFGEEKDKDWRCKYQFEPKYYDEYYRPLKYYKQSESSEFGPVNNKTIPMIRMSEIYYIAAECVYDPADPAKVEEAKGYLKTVKQGRGISKPDFGDVTSTEKFMKVLIDDERREFVGEGQTLFIYKRLNRVLPSYDHGDIPALNENFVLPKPESESNIK